MQTSACSVFYLFLIPFRTKRIHGTRSTRTETDSERMFCVFGQWFVIISLIIIWETQICWSRALDARVLDKIEIHISSDSFQLNPISERIARRHLLAAGESLRHRHTDSRQPRHSDIYTCNWQSSGTSTLIAWFIRIFYLRSTQLETMHTFPFGTVTICWDIASSLISECCLSRQLLLFNGNNNNHERRTSENTHSVTHIEQKRNKNSR